MLQMYKVFIYDKPVYITSDVNFKVENCQQFTYVNVDKVIKTLESEQNEAVVICCPDIEVSFNEFLNKFVHIKAAGGVVENGKNELLFIYRLGKWDLPKGKLEVNESIRECAVREVEEECNISQLSIVHELPNTYHCYPFKGAWVFKTTYWYKMATRYTGKLSPQTEEGIETVEWLSKHSLSKVNDNTYLSIKEVLKAL
jgi:8-oxo-dGTP pyrophosphatase MutT (NUDIX family)